VGCAPELRRHTGDIFPTEVHEFPRGRVVSFYVWRQTTADGGSWQAWFLSGLVLWLDGHCWSLGERPQNVDVETESQTRTFWDVVPFKGDEYLIIRREGYEDAQLEAYRIDPSRLTRVIHEYVWAL
jgi:hypothetical protein